MAKNLLDKVWDLHKVGTLPSGQDQLFIGMHLIHEVTSPQAFQALSDRGLSVMFPGRTFTTVRLAAHCPDEQKRLSTLNYGLWTSLIFFGLGLTSVAPFRLSIAMAAGRSNRMLRNPAPCFDRLMLRQAQQSGSPPRFHWNRSLTLNYYLRKSCRGAQISWSSFP